MREILFRGKCEDGGAWVEGSLDIVNNDCARILTKDRRELWNIAVIPETVGQFTGVKDKNGQKIFEGDIIKCTRIYEKGFGLRFEPRTEAVVYREGCFNPLYDCERNSYEVIGNIHDNPELLQERAEE